MRSPATTIPYSPSRLDSTIFFKNNLLTYLEGPKKILDIGCGRMFFLNFLKNTKFRGQYLGIDIRTPSALTLTRFEAKAVEADFLKYSFNDEFDFAACLWVLEHIKKDQHAIKKIYELLKPGGILILAVPSFWSLPFEFGRHGYHYYSLGHIVRSSKRIGFRIVNVHKSGGLLGFLFMIFYNWLRFAILIPLVIAYKLLSYFETTNKPWKEFSSNVISNTLYRYHRTKNGVKIHNLIVGLIVAIDNYFKILPASYILILEKPWKTLK